jgi:hypothetical protein
MYNIRSLLSILFAIRRGFDEAQTRGDSDRGDSDQTRDLDVVLA